MGSSVISLNCNGAQDPMSSVMEAAMKSVTGLTVLRSFGRLSSYPTFPRQAPASCRSRCPRVRDRGAGGAGAGGAGSSVGGGAGSSAVGGSSTGTMGSPSGATGTPSGPGGSMSSNFSGQPPSSSSLNTSRTMGAQNNSSQPYANPPVTNPDTQGPSGGSLSGTGNGSTTGR